MLGVAADRHRNDGEGLMGGLAPTRSRPVSAQPRWSQSMVSCGHRVRGLAPISTNRAATGTVWVLPLRLSRGGESFQPPGALPADRLVVQAATAYARPGQARVDPASRQDHPRSGHAAVLSAGSLPAARSATLRRGQPSLGGAERQPRGWPFCTARPQRINHRWAVHSRSVRPDTNGMDEFTLAVAVNDMQAVHKCPRIYRPSIWQIRTSAGRWAVRDAGYKSPGSARVRWWPSSLPGCRAYRHVPLQLLEGGSGTSRH